MVAIGLLWGQAQPVQELIKETEVTRIQTHLSSDAMEGRQTFSPGIEKAAAFLSETFASYGLQPGGHEGSFLQTFEMFQASIASANVLADGRRIEKENIICQTHLKQVQVNETSGYEMVSIGPKDNFLASYRNLRGKTTNLIVWVDTAHSKFFNRLKEFMGPRFASPGQQIYLLTPAVKPTRFSIDLQLHMVTHTLSNVVAVLPGKSKPDEYVIFSSHYDHLGYGKANEQGDSLYNGANDDASGTTAVMLLAKYFKAINNNERTIVFAAFTGEEMGGFGSSYFSKQYDAEKVKAMFNIEMIGTDSKWGLNSAYITGYEKTDMGKILENNLEGSSFKFYPDPYPEQQLFYRSDNATLARLGVPAHTISTSKMDNEPHYHKPSDEMSTLDMKNMTAIVHAIALSSKSIIAGVDTPTRVNAKDLR
jgi:Peptidase family M28